ncbi:hypothetical protein F5B20DRAFT_334289 [Whalleya microplaca]|nr:hypothetical protein F5B20DRAFT_334289 [Whalleya microplaca]
MAASQIHDDGDDRSFDLESSSHGLSNKPARSITPRGPLFTNLDEAHKKITSKLGSNNPFRDVSNGSVDSHGASLRDFGTSSFGKPIIGTSVPRAHDDALPGPHAEIAGEPSTKLRRVSSESSMSKMTMRPSDTDTSNPINIRKRTHSQSEPQDTSGSTVDKIYDQYTEAGGYQLSSSIDSSAHGYTFSNAYHSHGYDPRSREGAATRCGFRGEEAHLRHRQALHEVRFLARLNRVEKDANLKQRRLEATSSPSDAPQDSLLAAPQASQRAASLLGPNDGSSPLYASTVSDSQHLLDADAQADELRQARRRPLFPSPLRISERHGQRDLESRKHEHLFGDTGSSIADNTNESNDDPFQYDDGHYQAFLRPTKERDLSQALRRLSRVGAASGATFVSSDASPCDRAIGRPSNAKPAPDIHATNSRRKRPEGNIFTSFARKSPEKQVRDIKVVINPRPQLDLDEGEEDYPDKGLSMRDVPASDNNMKLPRDVTADGDWVTEATSEAGFGEGLAPNPQFIKATGSSIADLSDDDNIGPQGRFGSHDHILQHPAGEAQAESYELRNLKDTQQPIFLPKTRARRPAGFPENSMRLYSSIGKENDNSGQARPPLLRQWSNPFSKGGSARRANMGGQFGYKLERTGPSKYEFRDSASSYTPAMASNKAVCGTDIAGTYASLPRVESNVSYSEEPPNENGHLEAPEVQRTKSHKDKQAESSRNAQETPRNGYEKRLVDEAYPIRYNKYRPRPLERAKDFVAGLPCSFNGEPLSSASKFEFELLPLDQAQKKHKQQRESGETDETESAQVRYKRAKSNASSRGFSLGSPVDPPLPAHTRNGHLGPDLSSNFTPPNWHSLRYAFQDSPTPFSATGQDVLSPISNDNRANPESSPITPTTNYTATPTTARGKWFGRDQARLLPTRQQSYRNDTGHTVLRNRNQSRGGNAANTYISYKARSRLNLWFYIMAALSILPFFAVLVLTGIFDDSLAWFTRGEVYRLTSKQRKIIKYMLFGECILYTACIAAIIVYYVIRSKAT